MVGVDLSAGMLDRARQRNVYDELEQAELTQFMQQRPSCFDLIISSDTLVYVGDLAAVIAAGVSALRSGGVLIFSLEHAQDGAGEKGYRLEFSGRYAHGEDYVRQTLVEAGLQIRSIRRDILRKEGGKPVAGLVAIASKA
jgi:predicted TPR repeat methyltransferase